ncbi:MAG TPA: hypothetical protein VL475_04050 [Planctomycetaceae bacterium]|jgi:hypothetical protein|nr:hypothetical protein [Planctomycetaceae bacterium]
MRFLLAAAILSVAAPLFAQAPAPATYRQLIATRYADRNQLPADFAKPNPHYDFVKTAKLPAEAKILSAAKAANGAVWVVTDKGAFRAAGDQYVPLDVGPRRLEPGQLPVPATLSMSAVAGDRQGHIWVGTQAGVFITNGDQWWQRLNRLDGVPFEVMTCIHLAPNGDVWGGTRQGAWRLRDGEFRYFWGQRWLPGNSVKEIWTDDKGRAWLETDGGVACIEEKPITLADKAAHFDEIIQKRHMRRGFINEIHLAKAGDVDGEYRFEVSDNDGLWNAIYVGAMIYRYAVTKDPAARKQARVALDAMLDLERLTGISGYPARAVVTDEELKKGIDGVNLKETVRVPGETDKIWFRSPVDPTVWCKGDTSSDELDGHYYAWYLYYDLVADNEEKEKIKGVVRRTTDNILDHGWNLVGHTGRKTRWGVWAPELVNEDPFWFSVRPLNSLEILCYLKVAEHITGDAKYTRAYDELIDKHHYLLNTLLIRRGTSGQWMGINHSDDELLYLAYYPLIQLEKSPDRRRILLQSLTRSWESAPGEQGVRQEHSPLYNFMYGALTGRPCDAEEGIQTLQDWPWEMVEWRMQNRHRHDVQIKTALGFNRETEIDRVLPASERRLSRWNGNPFAPDGGSDGQTEDDGAAWSLAYWLGVYHGYVK